MASQCPACSKTNPAEARYCFYDGRRLADDGNEGPLKLGSLPFPMTFYFADGQACVNFNQLALACDERWEVARGLLADGVWPTFFGGIGRLDLAAVAKQAAKEPDRDVGLSQLLEKFPADLDALRLPKLALQSTEEKLGPLTPGTNHKFELVIINQGMLVLRGMVSTDCAWLVLGPPGAASSQKMFQTRSICNMPVRVLGHKLRAGLKPMQGEIVIDTNGGAITVLVQVEVPIIPFPRGTYANDSLAGARSPHEIVLKAKQSLREAAILFEQGAVKAWYASNGWTYPIGGSEGSGKGAIQQFVEALGLTKPPRLEIKCESLTFEGKIGEQLSTSVLLSTEEAKPVYAQAWSNEDWIAFGPIKYLGNKVRIPIEITVPPLPGQTAQAYVTIRGNGKQQFVVPVSVAVADAPIEEELIAVVVEEEPPGFPDNVIRGIQSFIRTILGEK